MNIIVTGGAGYIGSHACKVLANSGHLPVTYDNLSRGHREAVKWGPLEVGEIADGSRVREVLEKYQPAAVMHFAAFAYVGESVENLLLYYRNNIAGSAALLQAVVDFKPLPFILSSTCATYGLPKTIPISEDHPQQPINPYGFSKLAVERMLLDLERASHLPWVSLRYFNAAGSDPDQDIGEQHEPETHLIPLVLRAAKERMPVNIFGNDYDTPDGTCIRDYIHVMDIADAHVRSVEYLVNGGQSVALNLANARGYSVKEVIATAETICRCSVPFSQSARRPGDPAILVGSAEQAHTILGWKPARSDLQLQINDSWNWMNGRKW